MAHGTQYGIQINDLFAEQIHLYFIRGAFQMCDKTFSIVINARTQYGYATQK